MPSRPPSPLASMPSILAISTVCSPLATCRIRPVVRSPTSADWPSGSGARPQGAVRQVAITDSSVGAHGSLGAWLPLGLGLGDWSVGDGDPDDGCAVLGSTGCAAGGPEHRA